MRSTKFVSSTVRKALLAAAIVGCATTAANAQTVTNNGQGTNSGFFYSLFTSSGSSSMTFPNGAGNYQLKWSGVGDVVGGKGWNPGGNRSVGYNVGFANGFNYISVYGWTKSPLVEFYITEFGNLFTGNATHKGSVSSDGHTYQTWEHQQVNQPSIVGTATFEQYLDAWGGAQMGKNGTVTTGNHFEHWQSLGMPLGTFNYMILATEAFNGASGEVNATVW
jgi:endo-1,4-beta-xylanase